MYDLPMADLKQFWAVYFAKTDAGFSSVN
jgi:hypothetical protein